MNLHASQRAILAVLLSAKEPLSLQDVAAGVDLTSSMVLRHLQALEAEGLVERQGHRKEARYRAKEAVSIHWLGALPGGPQAAPTSRLLEWRSSGPPDWRFPLVARVPDEPAQETLYRFFDHASTRGYLTPWLIAARIAEDSDLDLDEPAKVARRFSRGSAHGAMSFVVFGSCARGDARTGSDLDLLVLLTGLEYPEFADVYEELFGRITFDMAPGAARPVALTFKTLDQFRGDPDFAHLRDQILREGITVHTTSRDAPYVEAMSAGAAHDGG